MNSIRFRPFWAVFFVYLGLFQFQGTLQAQAGQRDWADTLVVKSLMKEYTQLKGKDDNKSAIVKVQQSLAIYTDLYGEDHIKTARLRLYLARDLRNLRREEEALPLFQRSLRVFEAIHDTFEIGRCHNLLSTCFRNLRRYEEARQHIKLAIELMLHDSIKNRFLLADFKTTLGYAFRNEKNYLAAIPILEAARAVYLIKNDSSGLGTVCYHLGDCYFGLHDFVRAKEYYLAGLNYLTGIEPANASYLADLRVSIGFCCQKTGDPETGLRYLLGVKESYLKLGPDDLLYIGYLQDLGNFYLGEQQFFTAIEHFNACLAAKEKYAGAQSAYLLGTLQSLGEASMRARQFAQAEAYHRRGLQIARNLPGSSPVFTYRAYSDLAALRLAQGDFAASLMLCDTAFSIAGFDPAHPEKMLPRDIFRELCQRCAQALAMKFEQTGDVAALIQAEHYFALAAKTLYQEVQEVTVNSSKEIFYDRDHTVLEEWLDAQMTLFKTTAQPELAEAAFQIADQGKAFLLMESMQRSGTLRYTGLPDSVLQAELSLRASISATEKKLETAPAGSDSMAQILGREVSEWRAKYDALLRHIGQNYPEHFRLSLLQKGIPTRQLRKKYLAPGQTLLMYSLTPSHLYIFVLNRDTFCTRSIPMDDSLHTEVATLRTSLTEYFTTSEPDDALYDRNLDIYITVAQSLYQKLIRPVAHLLTERVVVIPEGVLCYVPFEALLASAPTDAGNFRTYPFWIRQKALSYALSTEYIVQTTLPVHVKSTKNWLGIAPFSPPQATTEIASSAVRHEKFSPLPFSGKEVTAIADLLQGETWLGAEARPGRFEKEAAGYRLLHLATHSQVDEQSGHYSYIVASHIGEPLYAKDLYLLSLAAEMVVLSSCDAGGGKLLRGEGIIGLVRAFTFSGARSIVAPLWVANDQSTANLMIHFYRGLCKGQPKDIALQAARIQVLDQSPTEGHPFFWAGFRTYGQVAPLGR